MPGERGSVTPINLPRAEECDNDISIPIHPFRLAVNQSERGCFHGAAREPKYKGCAHKDQRHCFLGFTLRQDTLLLLLSLSLLSLVEYFLPHHQPTMTLEEVLIQPATEADRAQCSGQALEDVLVSAKDNDCLTVGVYESAKVMNTM